MLFRQGDGGLGATPSEPWEIGSAAENGATAMLRCSVAPRASGAKGAAAAARSAQGAHSGQVPAQPAPSPGAHGGLAAKPGSPHAVRGDSAGAGQGRPPPAPAGGWRRAARDTRLRDVRGGEVEAEERLEPLLEALGDDLAVLILVEDVAHNAVVAGEGADLLAHGLGEAVGGAGLGDGEEAVHRLLGEEVAGEGAAHAGPGGVGEADGLKVQDDAGGAGGVQTGEGRGQRGGLSVGDSAVQKKSISGELPPGEGWGEAGGNVDRARGSHGRQSCSHIQRHGGSRQSAAPSSTHPSGVLSAMTVKSVPFGHVQTSDVTTVRAIGFSAVVSDAWEARKAEPSGTRCMMQGLAGWSGSARWRGRCATHRHGLQNDGLALLRERNHLRDAPSQYLLGGDAPEHVFYAVRDGQNLERRGGRQKHRPNTARAGVSLQRRRCPRCVQHE